MTSKGGAREGEVFNIPHVLSPRKSPTRPTEAPLHQALEKWCSSGRRDLSSKTWGKLKATRVLSAHSCLWMSARSTWGTTSTQTPHMLRDRQVCKQTSPWPHLRVGNTLWSHISHTRKFLHVKKCCKIVIDSQCIAKREENVTALIYSSLLDGKMSVSVLPQVMVGPQNITHVVTHVQTHTRTCRDTVVWRRPKIPTQK